MGYLLNNLFSIPGTGSSSTDLTSPSDVQNYELTATVNANALTVALKNAGGTDPSSDSPVKISFRDSPATAGTYTQRSVAAALSISVPSGTTLGQISGQVDYVYVWALDNSGTVELALSSTKIFDEGTLQTTTAISGGTSRNILYSTTARTDKAIRFLGRIASNQTVAGTWATAPSEISLVIAPIFQSRSAVELYLGNGHGSTLTRIRRFTGVIQNMGSAIGYTQSATEGDAFVIQQFGLFSMAYQDLRGGAPTILGISKNTTSGTLSINAIAFTQVVASAWQDPGAGNGGANASATVYLQPGDVLRAHTDGGPNAESTGTFITKFMIAKVSD